MPILLVVCALTFLHYVGAQMRAAPVLPLYAVAHGATATAVGIIFGAHMAAAAGGSIPLGRASDVWGRRRLLMGGVALGVVTSLLLPLAGGVVALTVIYGLAGFGAAAFTPSALSLVGDAAVPGRAGSAFAWYSTAHYGAIAVGPFIGGLVAERWGYRAVFIASAAVMSLALIGGLALPARAPVDRKPASAATFGAIKRNPRVWAGWIVSVSGFLIQGVVFTFFPLLAHERGLTPSSIGTIFLVLGLANTVARFPAGWMVDRTKRDSPYAIGGVVAASVVTVVLPHVETQAMLLALAAIFGALSGAAFVAVGVALAGATTPATRGVVMGGYSTALYLGLAVGSFALGPVITRYGHVVGFAVGGAAGVVGAVVAALLWAGSARSSPQRPAAGAG